MIDEKGNRSVSDWNEGQRKHLMQTILPSNQTRLHCSLPTAEQDAERPAWRRSAPPRGRGRERCGLHWNESSAREGFKIGFVVQAVAVSAYLCYGYCLTAYEWWTEAELFTAFDTTFTPARLFELGTALTANDPNTLRAGWLGAFFNQPIGLAYSVYSFLCKGRENQCFVPI